MQFKSLTAKLSLKPVKVMRTLNLSLWLLLCNSLMSKWVSGTEDLYIGTFYAVSVSSKGWSSKGVMPAVQMALDHVNNNQSILPGYTLHEDWRDSKVSRRHRESRKFR